MCWAFCCVWFICLRVCVDRGVCSGYNKIIVLTAAYGKQYAAWIEGYTGDVLLVGISYDKNKTHQCLIEKCVKSGADLTGTEYQ